MRADDIADIYADGVFMKTINGPFSTSTVTIPDNTRLLAVRGTNTVARYGFIIKHSDGFVTDTRWKCSNTQYSTHTHVETDDNWYELSYNDDDWEPARVLSWPSHWAPHGLDPAKIIWARAYADVVYCRGWVSKYQRVRV